MVIGRPAPGTSCVFFSRFLGGEAAIAADAAFFQLDKAVDTVDGDNNVYNKL